MPVDPQLAGFLQFIKDAGCPPVSEGTSEAARKGFVAMSAGAAAVTDLHGRFAKLPHAT